jgi:Holliday junction resolvasome RuvABC DNA-binding subunit
MLALTTLGFKKPDALRAVERAREQLADDAPLEAVLRAALRACPR